MGKARSFGDYEVLEQIGRGGMGIVFKARQKSLNRLVALKMILNVESASPVVMARFHVEAEAAAKLEHPNIVSTHEFGEVDGQPFFSMRLIEGSNLAKEMPRLSLASLAHSKDKSTACKARLRKAQERIASLVAAIARAIHYAHQHGVVHRDLKPTNILIDQQGQPHLTDFGIAKILAGETGLTGTDDLLGTPSYMSPEQAAGKPATRAADIYSLGVILYELLTGRPPFRADTPLETLRRVKEEEPTHPTSLNRQADTELATICLKCLEKDPLRRYSSAEAMAEDLERWLRHEPIHARRTSSPEKLVRWCRRKPALAAVAVLLILLSIISMITALLFARLSEQHKEAAIHAETDNRKLSDALRVANEGIVKDLGDLWIRAEAEPYVEVSSEKRATIEGRLVEKSAAEQRITFGVYTYYDPPTMLKKFSPLLTYLETKISATWHTQALRIDFRIYRSYTNGLAAFETGEIDFMRMGPSSYVLTKERSSGITLLASQNELITGAIFALKHSDIHLLADLRDKPFAFGDRESTLGNYLVKLKLLTNGLHANDLSTDSRHLRGHEEVTEAVKKGAYAAGAGNKLVVGPDFKILAKLETDLRMPWVAKSGINSRMATVLRRALLGLHDTNILQKLESNLTGFRKVEDREYDRLRGDMRRSAEFGEIRSL